MSYFNRALKTDKNGVPVPQIFNPAVNDFQVLEGSGNKMPMFDAGTHSRLEDITQTVDGILDGTTPAKVNLVGTMSAEVTGIGSFHYAAPFDNLVIMPDVSTTISSGQSSEPSLPVKVIDFKRIGIYADLKDASDVKLIFEVSPSGVGMDWFLLEEKTFSSIAGPLQYFILADGDDILANYVRVTVENTGASPITMPFIRAVVRG